MPKRPSSGLTFVFFLFVKQVNKIEVNYDKTSKQVDVQALKETLWSSMQETQVCSLCYSLRPKINVHRFIYVRQVSHYTLNYITNNVLYLKPCAV